MIYGFGPLPASVLGNRAGRETDRVEKYPRRVFSERRPGAAIFRISLREKGKGNLLRRSAGETRAESEEGVSPAGCRARESRRVSPPEKSSRVRPSISDKNSKTESSEKFRRRSLPVVPPLFFSRRPRRRRSGTAGPVRRGSRRFRRRKDESDL